MLLSDTSSTYQAVWIVCNDKGECRLTAPAGRTNAVLKAGSCRQTSLVVDNTSLVTPAPFVQPKSLATIFVLIVCGSSAGNGSHSTCFLSKDDS